MHAILYQRIFNKSDAIAHGDTNKIIIKVDGLDKFHPWVGSISTHQQRPLCKVSLKGMLIMTMEVVDTLGSAAGLE